MMVEIPVRKEELQAILRKRKMMAKVSCCLCERRIGWFCPSALERLFASREGNCVCEICWEELQRNGGFENDREATDKA